MKTLMLMLGLSVLPALADAEEPEYQGKSLDYWVRRTQPEYSLSERREAIRTLQQIGMMQASRAPVASSRDWVAEAVVPTLNGLLKDKDAAIHEEAVLAICGIDRQASKDAIPNLTELLGDPIERIRENAATALCFRGPTVGPAIPALVKVILYDTSLRVRHDAAMALRTSGPKGVEVLLGMLDDKSAQVRYTAVSMFEGQYPNDDPHETPFKAVPKFVALLQDESPEVRKSAAIALVRISDVPLDVISYLLRHKDIEVRHAAADNLVFSARLETDQFRAELLEFMKGDMDFCRTHPSLFAHAGPNSIPILLRLLNDRSAGVRGHTASALGQFGPAAKEAAGPLKRLLGDQAIMPSRDDDERVCHCAAAALNRILGDKDYREGLPPLTPDGL